MPSRQEHQGTSKDQEFGVSERDSRGRPNRSGVLIGCNLLSSRDSRVVFMPWEMCGLSCQLADGISLLTTILRWSRDARFGTCQAQNSIQGIKMCRVCGISNSIALRAHANRHILAFGVFLVTPTHAQTGKRGCTRYSGSVATLPRERSDYMENDIGRRS